MKEPVEHVIRAALPWRADEYTECGRPLNDITKAITRDELRKRVADLGKTRAAMLTCITCAQAAARHRIWEEDPVDAIRREVWGQEVERFGDELRALAALVAAHPDEFDGYLTGLAATSSLSAARARRLRRIWLGQSPQGRA